MYFEMIFEVHIAYDRPLDMSAFVMVTIFGIFSLIFLLSIGAIIEHVSSLYQRLKFTNVENVKLLNGMHEGLLILSKPDSVLTGLRTTMFCN